MIDWDRVRELRDEVGREVFDEVVCLFLDECETVLVRLGDIADCSELEAELHFLKGSALTLGFTTFAAECLAGERAARQGLCATVDTAALAGAFAQSKAAFLPGLGRL